MGNPFKILQNLDKKPPLIPSDVISSPSLSDTDKQLIKQIGLRLGDLRKDLLQDTQVQWDRQSLYSQIDRSLDHWLVGSAMELYADYSTNFNQLHNASVWVTSDNATYERELNKFLQETLGIEEKIFDWANVTGAYGNLFVKVNGIPGTGIVSVDDSKHPLQVSRVDHEGILVGFYNTPIGQFTGDQKLMHPYDYVHFRLLGARKKRTRFGELGNTEFRSMYMLTGQMRQQATTRYGTSLLVNALPVYQRLRLAEDSILLARLTRGIIRYIWKLKVDSQNMEAVGELIDQYAMVIKRARALDISAGSPNYDSKSNPMSVIEDLFVPVWGDINDLSYEEVGGKADIRWIVDIEELRNQLASALRCPLSLLGGFVQEASGQLGSQAIEKLDIRFARSARRLQRALKNGIKRLCQIHLAYMNMDPDPRLFEVNMSETSTAEEESLKESLDTGVDIVDKFLNTYGDEERFKDMDMDKLANYLNQKILKLEDFNIEDFKKLKDVLPEEELEPEGMEIPTGPGEEEIEGEEPITAEHRYYHLQNTDLISYVPVRLDESSDGGKKSSKFSSWLAKERHTTAWEEKYGETVIQELTEDEVNTDVPGQKVMAF